MYGADLSGYVSLIGESDYGSFTATGLLNYVRGKNATTNDNLYNIMPLNGRLALEHRLNTWSNTVEVEMVAAKTNVSQVRNEVETGGYGLIHLRSNYQWDQVYINFGIENLLDTFYNDPLGGAYLGQGKTMPGTGVAWGLTVPGMGRSIYAGATLKF
jgi:iron complex outermembrane receptor protein